ncbi:hypothetical protein ACNQFZ_21220 [Schinkia sp. CFF1]
MKKLLITFITIGLLSFSSQTVIANPLKDDVFRNFMQTLLTKGEEKAEKYVASDVNIPEIRENTPIRRFAGLPSPKENVRVSIAYFDDGENEPERIAFIWEVTSTKDKITDICVVFDGSNPMMNELKVVKEYDDKFRKRILVPSSFPFDITHVDGYVDKDILMLRYRNKELNGTLQIKVVPKDNVDIERFKGKNDRYYTLKDGTTAIYQPNYHPAYRIIFNKNEFRYYIGINKSTKKNMIVDDLIKVANSMLFIGGLS